MWNESFIELQSDWKSEKCSIWKGQKVIRGFTATIRIESFFDFAMLCSVNVPCVCKDKSFELLIMCWTWTHYTEAWMCQCIIANIGLLTGWKRFVKENCSCIYRLFRKQTEHGGNFWAAERLLDFTLLSLKTEKSVWTCEGSGAATV